MWRRNRQKSKLGERIDINELMKENRRADPNVLATRRNRRNQQGNSQCATSSGSASSLKKGENKAYVAANTVHAFELSTADHEKSCRFHRHTAQLYSLPRDTSLDTSLQYIYMTASTLLQNSEDLLTRREQTHR